MNKIILLIAILLVSITPFDGLNAKANTQKQDDCIAAAIHHEARGESLKGQIAVAEVILARTKSKKFAATPCAVVLQPKQFSFVKNGKIPAVPQSAMQRLRKLVAQIRNGRVTAGMKTALFFHAAGLRPKWRRPLAGIIGRHVFYR